jgi:hypothetical protein
MVNPDRPACDLSHYCLKYRGSSDTAVAIFNMLRQLPQHLIQLIEYGIIYDAFLHNVVPSILGLGSSRGILRGLLDPEDGGSAILRNSGTSLPNDTGYIL